MRRIALLIVVLLAAGCGTNPTRLTVMTYNIHHAAGMDAELDVPRIARVIAQSNPDLVALQEVDKRTIRTNKVDQAAKLGKLLKMNVSFGKAMDYDGGQYGNAVLAKRRIKSQRVIALPFGGGEHEPRCALVTRIGTPAGDVLFVSTHLDHKSGRNDRLEQMQTIAAALRDEKLPIILAGDFNCDPGSAPLKLLHDSWLRASGDEPTYSSTNPTINIDHVFVRPAHRWRVISTQVIDEQVASDHRPVVVTLELSPPARR